MLTSLLGPGFLSGGLREAGDGHRGEWICGCSFHCSFLASRSQFEERLSLTPKVGPSR